MDLYLAQHGAALEKTVDPDRPLSAAGRADVARIAEMLRTAGVAPRRVLHSGKTRADQTAQLLAQQIAAGAAPEAAEGLAPNDSVERFAKHIGNWKENTLVCGHQPFMGRLVSFLLIADESIQLLEFQPGSVAGLRNESGKWTLSWFLRPELCARSQT